MMKPFVLVIFCQFLSFLLSAQTQNFDDPHFSKLGLEDGLPESTVNRFLHDGYGYVWIGTQNGIVRYDGYRMKKYDLEANDINSKNIRIVFEDRRKNIWIGTLSGLYKYDRLLDRVLKINVVGNDNLKNCAFTFIKDNVRGEVWMMYNNNTENKTCLALFDPHTKHFTIYSNKETGYRKLNAKKLYGICELDADGNPWIGTDRAILEYLPERRIFKEHILANDPAQLNYVNDIQLDAYVRHWLWFRLSAKLKDSSLALGKYDTRKNTVTLYKHSDNNKSSINHSGAMYATRDSHNQAWFATLSGLARYDSAKDNFTNFNMPLTYPGGNSLWRAVEDAEGNLWCKGLGISKFDMKKGTFQQFVPDYSINNEGGILALPVMNISMDKSGSPWFGVGQRGLQWLDKAKSKYRYYRNVEGAHHFFPGGSVLSMKESPDGNVWIGGENGLFLWHTLEDSFELIKFTNPVQKHVNIHTMAFDDAGNIWFSATSQFNEKADAIRGLYCYNPSTHQTKNYQKFPKDSIDFTRPYIQALAADNVGNIWIGTTGAGLFKMNRFTEKITRFPFIRNNNTTMPDHNSLDDDQIFSLYLDKNRTLWIGTNNGSLNKYDIATGKFTSFIDRIPISVASITEDSNNNIWVSSMYSGVISLNKKTNEVKTYLEKDGLSYDGPFSVETDKAHKLWLVSATGISLIDLSTKQIRNFTTKDGLPAAPISPALTRTGRGHVLFGAKDGFIMVDAAKFEPEPTVPATHIETVQFANLNTPEPFQDSILQRFGNDKTSLAYNQNRVTFNYVGIHHPSRTKIQYAYKLTGYDSKWVNAGEQRSVTYTNLSPGKYTFAIKAANSDGVWSGESDSIIILIAPPWWRTWWAYLFYVIIAGAVIYVLYRNWLSRIRNKQSIILHQKETAQLKVLDEMKTRFFSNIAHELRTPLSLIIAPMEQMQKAVTEPAVKSQLSTMQNNSEQLLYLINQLLDMSKLEAKSMSVHLRKGDLMLFIRQVIDGFSFQAQAAKLSLESQINDEDKEFAFDAESLRKILQNLLSNAIKFTPAGGSVMVKADVRSVSVAETMLYIEVIDTGIGIPPAHLNNIFNRFFQVDDSRTRSYSGTGIGLSLVKELAELLGGRVTASHNVSGTGTTLSLRMPVSNNFSAEIPPLQLMRSAAPGPQTETDTNSVDMIDVSKPVLLITEDHPELRTFLLSLFEKDYRVLTAANGKEGWELAQQEIPDIIISDMMMPEMDGIEFCRLVKTTPATNHIGFIMLTAKTSHNDVLEGLQNQADEYLSKPFHTDELMLRIRNFLDHRSKLQGFYHRQLSVPGEPLQSTAETDPFLKEIYGRIDERLDDADLTIDQLATSVYMSSRTLVRKLNAVAGMSPSEVLKQYRLKKSALYLAEGISVTEVAWKVGFTSRNYFSTAFKSYYGIAPSEYGKEEVK